MPHYESDFARHNREVANQRLELNKVTDLLSKVCEELYTDQNETFEDTCNAISSVKGLKEWWDKQ